MLRTALALILGGLLLASTVQSAEHARHSGRVVAVNPDGQTITLEALGAGTAKGNQVVAYQIALTPETTIKLAIRSEDESGGGWLGDFAESALTASSVRAGDFATIETRKRDGRLIAVSVVVIRPGTASR